MPNFSFKSEQQLSTCHPDLQRVAREAIKWVDFTVLEGHRNHAAQDAAVANGNSKLPWPKSKHNLSPSLAMDLMPYPIDWTDYARLYLFVGFIIGTANQLGIKLRAGADWNGKFDPKRNKFPDLPHFELSA